MEVINQPNENNNDNNNWDEEKYERNRKRSKIFLGCALIIGGGLLLAKKLGAEIPHGLFSWPMILILVGIASGIKHSFKRPGAYILLLIGGIFLAEHLITGIALKPFVWPVVIMLIGIFVILKPRRRHDQWRKHWHRHYDYEKKKCRVKATTSM